MNAKVLLTFLTKMGIKIGKNSARSTHLPRSSKKKKIKNVGFFVTSPNIIILFSDFFNPMCDWMLEHVPRNIKLRFLKCATSLIRKAGTVTISLSLSIEIGREHIFTKINGIITNISQPPHYHQHILGHFFSKFLQRLSK